MRNIFRSSPHLPWPDALELLVGALRSGMNLEQALFLFYETAPNAIRMVSKKRLQGPWAWLTLDQKIKSLFCDPELDLVRAALCLSLESGTRQVSLIETAVHQLRERRLFEERVDALTAHGRATAWVVGLSPLLLGALLYLIAPEMVEPLVATNTGRIVLGIGMGLIVIGLYAVHRMARIDA